MAIAMKYGNLEQIAAGRSSSAKISSALVPTTSGQSTTVTLGWQPKYLAIVGDSNTGMMIIYNADRSTTAYQYAGASTHSSLVNLGTSSNYRLYSVDASGFTMNNCAGGSFYYFAIG